MENNKGLITIIIVLFVLVIGLGGFIAYERFFQTEEDDTLTTIGESEINLNIFYQVSDILNQLDSAFNDSSSAYIGHIYGQKRVIAKELDNSTATYLALQSVLLKTGTNQIVSSDLVKSNYGKIFGDTNTYKPISIDAGSNYKVLYHPDQNNYTYQIAGPTSIYQSGYVAYNLKTSLAPDKVIVKRKVFYVDYTTSDNVVTANIYKTNSKEQYLGKITLQKGVLNSYEVISKYGSKIPTYDYTFVKKTQEDYNFYSIEQSK